MEAATAAVTKTVVLDGVAILVRDFFGTNSADRFQLLYRAQEVAGSGNIQSISLRYDIMLATAVNCPNVTILMGHTSLVNLSKPASMSWMISLSFFFCC